MYGRPQTEAASRAATILAANPYLPPAVRARILGRPRPTFEAAKTHSITVDLRTGKRTVESVVPVVTVAPAAIPFRPRLINGLPQSYFRILDAVADAWELESSSLVTPQKANCVAYPRFAAFWLIEETMSWSLPRIGRAFKRDHTTVLSGIRRAKVLHDINPDWRSRYEAARAVVMVEPQ